jgi:hypothetical protein
MKVGDIVNFRGKYTPYMIESISESGWCYLRKLGGYSMYGRAREDELELSHPSTVAFQ